MRNTCDMCKWFNTNKPTTCHKYPPVVIPWMQNAQGPYDNHPIVVTDSSFSVWPEVDKKDFCSKFAPAEGEAMTDIPELEISMTFGAQTYVVRAKDYKKMSKAQAAEVIRRAEAYEKLYEISEKAYAAIEMMVPDKFIGLIKLPNGKVYGHRTMWEALYFDKAKKQALGEKR